LANANQKAVRWQKKCRFVSLSIHLKKFTVWLPEEYSRSYTNRKNKRKIERVNKNWKMLDGEN